MTDSDWTLDIDGHEYQPIPESWIQNGIDDRDGEGPQLLAVSAATWRGSLRIRYAHPTGTKVGQVFEPAADGDTGSFPQNLLNGTWPRSIAASQLEPIGDVRIEERQHLDALWSDRLDAVLDQTPDCDLDDERLIADGGVPSSDDSEQPLAEQIREKLVVDEPDEVTLVDALEGAIEIVDGSWRIAVRDGIEEREPKDQVFTYLLAKYAAARVSDGDVPMTATREELYEHFDRQLVKQVCEHGWVRHWDGNVQIRPNFYKHTADELAARYADRSVDAATEQQDDDLRTDGGMPPDSRPRSARRPKWSRRGGEGLPIPHDTDADQFWLFTCCHCGRRWVDPPGPPHRCSCESTEIVCHRFDPDTYWNIKGYGDPEGSQ